jgi:hypothetical protein
MFGQSVPQTLQVPSGGLVFKRQSSPPPLAFGQFYLLDGSPARACFHDYAGTQRCGLLTTDTVTGAPGLPLNSLQVNRNNILTGVTQFIVDPTNSYLTITQSANGQPTLRLQRFTGSSPTGHLLDFLDNNGTTVGYVDVNGNASFNGSVTVGSGLSTHGVFPCLESGRPTFTAGYDYIVCDQTTHGLLMSNNGGTPSPIASLANIPTVGTVTIPASSLSGSYVFTAPFNSVPVCTLTPTVQPSGTWWVTQTTTGVIAHISASTTSAQIFNFSCAGNPN